MKYRNERVIGESCIAMASGRDVGDTTAAVAINNPAQGYFSSTSMI